MGSFDACQEHYGTVRGGFVDALWTWPNPEAMAGQPVTQPSRAESLRSLLQANAVIANAPGSRTDCVRLCAGLANGLAGLLIDRFGSLLVAVDYCPCGPDSLTARELLALVKPYFPECHLVAKARAAGDGSNAFVAETFSPADAGIVAPLVAFERGLAYEIGIDPAHDFGIFLDAAKARLFVRGIAEGKRVLNLFSYAGAFGIAAATGGAAEVTNVDPNRSYLAWSRRNAALNNVSMRVLPDTTQDFLAKHLRRLARNPQTPGFDLVVVDPPAFCVGRGDDRLMRLLWPQLFESLRTMQPERVVLLCNDKYYRSRQSFEQSVQSELGGAYKFERLGTCLSARDVVSETPSLRWEPQIEDPHYVEPVVLAGVRLDLV